jgi:putative peptidoglycan lipid II flippase
VVLLGLTGLVVGILNAYDHFTIPALAPLAWNMVIIVLLAVLRSFFEGDDQLYAYAIAVLAGTTVQFLMVLPVLRRYGFRFQFRRLDWRDPRVARVLRLLIPVTIAFGLINFNVVINSAFGSRVADYAPRAMDAAFRVYMLPQGMFSVALATVIFPTLARYAVRDDLPGLRGAAANGMRQIFLLLIPAAAFTLVLPEPVTRLIYEHGEFDSVDTERVADALFWFSFALPLNGVNLILSRAFFSLQRPWLPAALGVSNIGLNIAVAWALYEPMGVGGIVLGTAAGNLAMLVGQVWVLRRQLRGLEVSETLVTVAKILLGSAVLAGAAYATWRGLDELLGRSLLAQIVSVTGAATVGGAAYAAAVSLLRVHEAAQIRNLVAGRLRGLRGG